MATMLMQPVTPQGRVGRYPKHPFQINEVPYHVTPICLAPVLPGETLENLYFEARIVSDPVKNKLIGWKKEYYFFYVKVTDLLTDAIRDMFVDPDNTDLSVSLGAPAHGTAFYQAKGGIDYMNRCLQRITAEYFRDEGEAWNKYVGWAGYPMCQIRDTFWMDSLTDKDLMPQGPDISEATTAGDLDRLMDAFEQLRSLGIANMTYEDFLRSYGISVPKKDENKPELLARFSDFQYPSNTVTQGTGAVTSALSWVFKNSERKPKFFREPGFIVGISITRPKLYFAGLAGSAASFMTRAWDWMPGYLSALPETSLKMFGLDAGPLGDRTVDADAYWIDMRDVLMYGDQYQNIVPFNPAVADNGALNMVALPDASLNVKNPSLASIQQLFTTPAASYFVRSDGMVSLTIKGAQVDHTRGNFAEA
ncbi:MAG: hypothetical protein DI635_15455 [Pseudoxanthomonas suwonensis]|nr:MAG: hypothetical protein DI635_15455 [Pseudoxanthomonas suwonensis]